MPFFSIEHSKAAYCADYALYTATAFVVAAILAWSVPSGQRLPLFVLVGLGLAGWTLVEYALHRFVLHGLRPFSTWHTEHHSRPAALICAPTIVSASLIAVMVFMPALLLGGLWHASALTLGLICGYLAYAVTHHATHHWHSRTGWLRRRRHWHALHHSSISSISHYGVTTSFWDHFFSSHRKPLPVRSSIRKHHHEVQ